MKKTTLKLVEFYALDVELNGFVNPQTKEILSKGLLQEKLPLKTKFWLSDISKKVADVKTTTEKLREELIKKYGDVNEHGGFSIPPMKSNPDNPSELIVNPNYGLFQKEFDVLLNEEKEIEYKPFSINEFDSFETDANYPVFFKFIEEPI